MDILDGFRIDEKVAIVPGGGGAIGSAIAATLAAAGARVTVVGRTKDTLEQAADKVRDTGSEALTVVGDMTTEADADRCVAETLDAFGRVDIIVNNAAAPYGSDRVAVVDMDADVFKTVIDVKVLGTFYACRAAVKQMIEQGEGGRIINLSSTMGKSGRANTSAYNAANFAIDGFTQALAKEVGQHNITANSVCPGTTETSRLDPVGRGDVWQGRLQSIPISRAGTDDEVGELIGFLCSPRAGYITGQSVNINGGSVTER